jgi:hypothetical protein
MEPACSKALVNHREAYWSIVCSESRAVHFPTVGFDEHIFLAPSIGPVRNRLYVEWELIDNDFAGVEPVADGVPNIFCEHWTHHDPAPSQRKLLRLEHFDMQCESMGS